MKKYKRILILGKAGVGKNWLGERLSKKLQIPFKDIDDISWKKRFTVQRSKKEKSEMLKNAAKKDRWVMGGWASKYTEPAIKRAELIIILKASFLKTTYRIIKRHIQKRKNLEEESMHNIPTLIVQNFSQYTKKSKIQTRLKEIRSKYQKKNNTISKGRIKILKKYLTQNNPP